MFTLTLVITTLCFHELNGEHLTVKRHPRQCSTCSNDAAELLASPWYGVPQSVAYHQANKYHQASRLYRDTKEQQSMEISSRFGVKRKQNDGVIAAFDLPKLTFGEQNFHQGNNRERQERSNLEEFEFQGKKYALRRKKVQPSVQEPEPQESAPVETSSNGGRNSEYLLMLYNAIQKVMQTVDPTKSMYENIEHALFEIAKKIIHNRMTTLFEDSVSQRNDDQRSRDSNGKSNSPRQSEPEQSDIPLSIVAKQILEQLRSRNEMGDLNQSVNGHAKVIVTDSAAGPRYENALLLPSNHYPNYPNQDQYVNRSPGIFQSSMQQQSSRPVVRSTDRANPGSVVTNIEESSSIYRNGRGAIPEVKNSNTNRDLYNGKAASGHRQTWSASTQYRDVNDFAKASTPLEYESQHAKQIYDDPDDFVRFARSERPTENVEIPKFSDIENSDNSSDLVKPENPEKLEKSLETSLNVSTLNDSLTLGGSKNSTSVSEKLNKALGEYSKSDKSETTEMITTSLDEAD